MNIIIISARSCIALQMCTPRLSTVFFFFLNLFNVPLLSDTRRVNRLYETTAHACLRVIFVKRLQTLRRQWVILRSRVIAVSILVFYLLFPFKSLWRSPPPLPTVILYINFVSFPLQTVNTISPCIILCTRHRLNRHAERRTYAAVKSSIFSTGRVRLKNI